MRRAIDGASASSARSSSRLGRQRSPHWEAPLQEDPLEWHEAAAYAARARGRRQRPRHGWESLTPTELQVAELVAEGQTNPQIAQRLLMGRATVKTHLEHVFTKLGVKLPGRAGGDGGAPEGASREPSAICRMYSTGPRRLMSVMTHVSSTLDVHVNTVDATDVVRRVVGHDRMAAAPAAATLVAPAASAVIVRRSVMIATTSRS